MPFPKEIWISSELVKNFALEQTNAYRVFSGFNAWIERFGNDFLISYRNDQAVRNLVTQLEKWLEINEIHPQRIFGRLLTTNPGEESKPVLLKGNSQLNLQTEVLENKVRFGIDFSAGYSVGLFIDQRKNRAFLRHWAVPRVLNCFAYTCSFSVVAAMAGSKTVSVDLSKKSLDRGKINFQLNQLDLSSNRFIADDVFDVLPRLQRKEELFDGIILDPPTFSRGIRGNVFKVERDFEKLLDLALSLAAPKAKILLSVNCSKIEFPEVRRLAAFTLKKNRRTGTLQVGDSLPDIPSEAMPTTLWIKLQS